MEKFNDNLNGESNYRKLWLKKLLTFCACSGLAGTHGRSFVLRKVFIMFLFVKQRPMKLVFVAFRLRR
jgi:hypothetical protein